MREILFRGYCHYSQKFVYGLYDEFLGDVFIHSYTTTQDNNGEKKYNRITYPICNRNTIGQYTGRNDKNGNKIFENDIVKVEYNQIGNIAVKFENGKFNISDYIAEKCVIVGNIHDNTELNYRNKK